MANLTAHITTFNCGRKFPSSTHLAAELFSTTTATIPPDLIVLCLQEIAPIGYAFLGGSWLAPYFASFTNIVHKAVAQHFESNADYIPLLTRHAGLTGLMIFARPEAKERIRWIETAGVGVGVFEMGNKGAVGARLGFEGDDDQTTVPVTFVSAHLAPMEEEYERRNEDWKNICQSLIFTRDNATSSQASEASQPLLGSNTDGANDSASSDHTLFSPISHIFFAGDLNYRTSDLSPHPTDHTLWPHPTSSPDHPAWRDLWANDQLTREQCNGKTLHHLSEAPINFPPTYKYSSAARQAAKQNKALPSTATDSQEGKNTWPWAQHRVPSWCDRVLFLSLLKPEVESYDALSVQPTSDHRPVTLSVKIPLRMPLNAGEVKAPFSMRRDWKERRDAARRYEMIVGFASYLALTWEGEAILAGTLFGVLGGYVVLRSMMGI